MRGTRGLARRLVVLAFAVPMFFASARPLRAQGAGSGATASSASVSPAALDTWIVSRYRGAHLLPDAALMMPVMAAAALAPRIETVRLGERVDTLWALHFNPAGQGATLPVPSTVRLAGPTGTVTTLSARLVARRPFRAPRTPDARAADTLRADAWRHGWAYLALLPHDARRNATRYRGWLLLGAPDPAPRR